jgi:tRNA 2-thiouridine synthesizing protein E
MTGPRTSPRAGARGRAGADAAHWELIHFLRAYFHGARRAGPGARDDPALQRSLGAERGSNHHLHEMFPVGGPQKQGNRLAGLLRTKGEH